MAEDIELLAPAGNWQILQAVTAAGADAVYFGGVNFSARAYAKKCCRQLIMDTFITRKCFLLSIRF